MDNNQEVPIASPQQEDPPQIPSLRNNHNWLRTLTIGFALVSFCTAIGLMGYFWTIKNKPSLLTQTTISPTIGQISPTPTEKLFSLTIPKDTDWIKYQAQCPALKNNIEIYYPKTWFPKEFSTVSDFEDPENIGGVKDCQVIFGYAETPTSYQSPNNEIATIRVSTWLNPSISLDDYLKEQIEVPKKQNYSGPKGVAEMTFNNQQFKALEYDNTPSFYVTPAYILYTKKLDRFFEISPIGRHGSKFDRNTSSDLQNFVFDSSAEIINKAFLARIRIL